MVAEARSDETFVALCLLTVTGASLLTQKLGFSDTAGAFAAGVLLSETNFRSQVGVIHNCTLLFIEPASSAVLSQTNVCMAPSPLILTTCSHKYARWHRLSHCRRRALSTDVQVEADIRPFRSLLLGLFFTTTGSSMDLQLLYQQWPIAIALLGGLLAVKIGIIGTISQWFGLSKCVGRPSVVRLLERPRRMFRCTCAACSMSGTLFLTQSWPAASGVDCMSFASVMWLLFAWPGQRPSGRPSC